MINRGLIHGPDIPKPKTHPQPRPPATVIGGVKPKPTLKPKPRKPPVPGARR